MTPVPFSPRERSSTSVRRQTTAEARITAERSGKLLAHGTTSCMIFEQG